MKTSTALALLASTASLATAQLGIDDTDVPNICRQICQPLISLSVLCSSESSTDSSCICENTSFDVVNLGSMCAICAEQANALNSDLQSISAACSFTQGLYNQLSASSVAATVIVTATHAGNIATTVPETPSPTSAVTGGSITAFSTGSSSSSSGNAAPTMHAHAAGYLAGAVAAGLLL